MPNYESFLLKNGLLTWKKGASGPLTARREGSRSPGAVSQNARRNANETVSKATMIQLVRQTQHFGRICTVMNSLGEFMYIEVNSLTLSETTSPQVKRVEIYGLYIAVWEGKLFARMILSGLGCRLQTCSCLATEWFNSTFRASYFLLLYELSVIEWELTRGTLFRFCARRCVSLFPRITKNSKRLRKIRLHSLFQDIYSLRVILDSSPSFAYSVIHLLTHVLNHACTY